MRLPLGPWVSFGFPNCISQWGLFITPVSSLCLSLHTGFLSKIVFIPFATSINAILCIQLSKERYFWKIQDPPPPCLNIRFELLPGLEPESPFTEFFQLNYKSHTILFTIQFLSANRKSLKERQPKNDCSH